MKGVFTLNVLNKTILCGKQFIKGVMAFAVALLILALLTAPVLVQASTPSMPEININLQINASWGGGDILNLDITDLDTGERQQVAIRLSDFISEGENVPYILLQAMDLLGERQSGVIQIENPLFDPNVVQAGATVGDSGSSVSVEDLPDNLQEIIAEANEPKDPPTLTPDGTGTVVDNIMTVNDIEFFTITTDNGSDFFLVVDRQRQSDNVYLLNTVTEADLMALAEARGENLLTGSPPASAAQVPEQPNAPTMEEILQAIQESAEQNQQDPTPQPQGNSSGIIFLIAIVLFLGGGALLFWKVLLPKIRNIGEGSQEDIEDDEGIYEDEHEYGDDDFSADYENVEVDESEGEDFNHKDGYDEGNAPDFEDNRGDADDEE